MPRNNYEGFCMDCVDELRISELFTNNPAHFERLAKALSAWNKPDNETECKIKFLPLNSQTPHYIIEGKDLPKFVYDNKHNKFIQSSEN